MINPTFTIRASSFAEVLDCAHRWEGKYLLGMNRPSSAAAHLGTSIHASTAAFDKSRTENLGMTTDEAAGVFVDALRHPDRPVEFDPTDSIKTMERIGLRLHSIYCNAISPQFDFVAVEMETQPLEIAVDGVSIILTGTMDRARIKKSGSGVGISDLKTGLRAVNQEGVASTSGHAPQLGVYELLYEHTTGQQVTLPASIIGLQTTPTGNTGISEVSNAREQLVGTVDSPGLIEMVAKMMKAGLFPPNPRSQLCSEKYCPRFNKCRFHS